MTFTGRTLLGTNHPMNFMEARKISKNSEFISIMLLKLCYYSLLEKY